MSAAPASVAPAAHARGWRQGALRSALFASDFHLHGGAPGGVSRARAFLALAREQDVDAVFLLGDVFAAWLGPSSLDDPGLAPFLDDLAALTREGRTVVMVHGNHDFLMGPELERTLGVVVAGEGTDVALGGRRVRVEHGDAFCTRDRGYIRLHRVLRHPVTRALWAVLPRAALDAVARSVTSASDVRTSAKPLAVMAMVDAAVVDRLARDRDLMVCGHVHAARDVELPVPGGTGRLVVMADFETTGSHAIYRDGELQLVRHDRRFAAPPGPVVTLDGPAGSGKSSVARALAARLGFVQLDSGALYRAVTVEALRRGLGPGSAGLGALAESLTLATDRQGRVLVAGRPMADELLRSPEVSAAVSAVSADRGVRTALLEVQRRAAWGARGLVAEGRDMATVVFPDAPHRFYLDARPEVRAARRLGQSRSEGASLEEVEAALTARDTRDAGREVAPLAVAPGARVLDTSELAFDQVVEQLALAIQGGVQGT
jgi:cytidylate kinase